MTLRPARNTHHRSSVQISINPDFKPNQTEGLRQLNLQTSTQPAYALHHHTYATAHRAIADPPIVQSSPGTNTRMYTALFHPPPSSHIYSPPLTGQTLYTMCTAATEPAFEDRLQRSTNPVLVTIIRHAELTLRRPPLPCQRRAVPRHRITPRRAEDITGLPFAKPNRRSRGHPTPPALAATGICTLKRR